MKYCDTTPSILGDGHLKKSQFRISLQSIIVFIVILRLLCKGEESSGKIVHKLIEVKPSKQTTPPKKPKRQTKGYIYEVREYAKNMAKWKAGDEFCKDRLWKFQVLTEHELGIK